MARPVSVVSADDLELGNEAELQAFIQSLLAGDEVGSKIAPLPILPPAPAAVWTRSVPSPVPAASAPTTSKKAPFRCQACGALRKGHQCVAFRPHEGKKRKTTKLTSKRDHLPPSTDSLLAMMGTSEGKYDIHRLDSPKLARFRELLNIWRTRSIPPGSVSAPDTSSSLPMSVTDEVTSDE